MRCTVESNILCLNLFVRIRPTFALIKDLKGLRFPKLQTVLGITGSQNQRDGRNLINHELTISQGEQNLQCSLL